MLGGKGKGEKGPGERGKEGSQKTRNITIEATMSLKTKEGVLGTKLKRTQNRRILSRQCSY